MRVQLVSDLHLEFPMTNGTMPLENVAGQTDLLVLAGDICVARKAMEFAPFIAQCAAAFPQVIYLAGNHEFYHEDIIRAHDKLLELTAPHANVHYLHNEVRKIGNYYIFGGTLWTNCNEGDPLTLNALRSGMNDYRLISWKSREHWKLRPEDTCELHRDTLVLLKQQLESANGPIIVATHHAPSRQSTHWRYANDRHMNGGYQSHLDDLILKYTDKIPLWVHGHVHDSFDYIIGNTRVVANPRGYVTSFYQDAENPAFDPGKVIELP